MNPEKYTDTELDTEPDPFDSPKERAWKNKEHYGHLADSLGLGEKSADIEALSHPTIVNGESEPIRNEDDDYRVQGKSIFAQLAGKLRFKDQKPRHLEDGQEVRDAKRQNLH